MHLIFFWLGVLGGLIISHFLKKPIFSWKRIILDKFEWYDPKENPIPQGQTVLIYRDAKWYPYAIKDGDSKFMYDAEGNPCDYSHKILKWAYIPEIK